MYIYVSIQLVLVEANDTNRVLEPQYMFHKWMFDIINIGLHSMKQQNFQRNKK